MHPTGPENDPGPILGIIGCQVLEDAMAYTVANDAEVRTVIVIDTGIADGLYEKLIRAAPDKNVKMIGEGDIASARGTGLTVMLRLMPIALHQIPLELRETIIREARDMEKSCKLILVFYGMCGGAFRDFDMMVDRFNGPTEILRDRKGEIVDDCVGAELGGTEEYLRFLLTTKHGFPLNSMWAKKWRHFMQETQLLGLDSDISEAKFVFHCMSYEKAIMIDSGTVDNLEYVMNASAFAKVFEFSLEAAKGSTEVFQSSVSRAKERLIGR
jgi:hypothetical protein